MSALLAAVAMYGYFCSQNLPGNCFKKTKKNQEVLLCSSGFSFSSCPHHCMTGHVTHNLNGMMVMERSFRIMCAPSPDGRNKEKIYIYSMPLFVHIKRSLCSAAKFVFWPQREHGRRDFWLKRLHYLCRQACENWKNVRLLQGSAQPRTPNTVSNSV